MDLKQFFQSKRIKIALAVIFAAIVILLVFQAGMFTGFKKASFSYQWGENYYKNFAGPRRGFMEDIRGTNMMVSHGIFGTVIKNDDPSLIVRGMDNNMENIVLMGQDTVINRFRDRIGPGDLKVNDRINVLGFPDSAGRMEAKLIRVLPPDFPGTNTPGFIPKF